MKRKPDMLWLLAVIFGLGIVTTGYTEVQWDRRHSTEFQQTQSLNR